MICPRHFWATQVQPEFTHKDSCLGVHESTRFVHRQRTSSVAYLPCPCRGIFGQEGTLAFDRRCGCKVRFFLVRVHFLSNQPHTNIGFVVNTFIASNPTSSDHYGILLNVHLVFPYTIPILIIQPGQFVSKCPLFCNWLPSLHSNKPATSTQVIRAKQQLQC